MKFAVISKEGLSTWAAARMYDEGHDVLVYHAPPITNPFAKPPHWSVGDGIVPIAKTWEQFVAFRPDVFYFDCTDFGPRADALRRSGFTVFGACAYFDKLENEREYGIAIARSIGMAIPDYKLFSTCTDALKWLEEQSDGKWYFKVNKEHGMSGTVGGDKARLTAHIRWVRSHRGDRVKHILQSEIKGAPIMTSAYWNGTTFLTPWCGTAERKEFGNDETGPKTGCSANVIWHYEDVPKIVDMEGWDKFAAILRKENCPPCIIDINAMADGEQVYFMEFTPRLGIDSEPTAQRLLTTDYSEFIARLCEGTLPFAPFDTSKCAYSIKLSVPPYPYEPIKTPDERDSCTGMPLTGIQGSVWGSKRKEFFVGYAIRQGEDGYEVGDPYGAVGISSTVGNDMETMNKACVKYAKSLDVIGLSFRTDADVWLQKDLAAQRKAGHEAPLL